MVQVIALQFSSSLTESSCWRATVFFFFNDTATTEIYTLSLHDALPILLTIEDPDDEQLRWVADLYGQADAKYRGREFLDRKSTRLNSSHANISYAVFCLKKTTASPRASGC